MRRWLTFAAAALLVPVLAAAWIGAAAAPCAAMTSDGHGATDADAAHVHHAMPSVDAQSTGGEPSRPGCPHCGPSSSDHAPGDAAAHARCAAGETAVAKDAGAKYQMSPRPRDGRYAEFRVHDPVGTPIDLAEKGWDV